MEYHESWRWDAPFNSERIGQIAANYQLIYKPPVGQSAKTWQHLRVRGSLAAAAATKVIKETKTGSASAKQDILMKYRFLL